MFKILRKIEVFGVELLKPCFMKKNLKKYSGLDYQTNTHATLNESDCQVVIDLPVFLCW